jgi:RimJ/RimL family protein N-acetyltransferase
MARRVCARLEGRLMEPSWLKSRRDELRPLMLDSLPWSPLDFIRGISPPGDRAMQIDALLRELPDADDLRFAHPLDDGAAVAVCAERLPWDSAFFGYGVARLHGVFPVGRIGYSPDTDYRPALQTLAGMAQERGVRYLFGVIDARDLPTIRALTALGFALIETRLYFHRPIRNYHYERRFQCRPATPADLPSLTTMAQAVENPYDRFNSDPFISREDALRLMVIWLRASVVDGFADATFVPDASNPGAVCTLKYHRDKAAAWGETIGQLVLALASPRTDNRLVGLISEVLYHLKDVGMEQVFFTTQIANRSAIRVAEHLGFKHGRGEYVFRLLL